jgi:hypothetical protein
VEKSQLVSLKLNHYHNFMNKNQNEEEVFYTEEQKNMKWSIMSVWNEMNDLSKVREPKIRDYISPSDIGKNYWDRYQKMMGVPEDMPYTSRVLRIFSAGDEFHNLMKNVFKAGGIFINSQDDSGWSVIEPTEKTLKVLGKYDVLAGGVPNVQKVKEHCELMGFSQFVKERTIKLAENLLERYPNGLPKLLYEFKSINSMAFWGKKNYLMEAYPWHTLQCYAYLKANNLSEGRVLYISKDDLTTAEFPIFCPNEKLENDLQKDLEEMSYFIKNKIEPPKPELIVFNPKGSCSFQLNKKKYKTKGCYEANWEVKRSSWFKTLTGFDNVEKWEESINQEILDKNNKLKAEFKEMNNLVKGGDKDEE